MKVNYWYTTTIALASGLILLGVFPYIDFGSESQELPVEQPESSQTSLPSAPTKTQSTQAAFSADNVFATPLKDNELPPEMVEEFLELKALSEEITSAHKQLQKQDLALQASGGDIDLDATKQEIDKIISDIQAQTGFSQTEFQVFKAELDKAELSPEAKQVQKRTVKLQSDLDTSIERLNKLIEQKNTSPIGNGSGQ